MVEGACWLWDGQRDWEGYGFKFVRRHPLRPTTVRAHNLVYAVLVGPIASGLRLDHLCRNTGCVNPAHLEPVTLRENTVRGVSVVADNARKSHCKRGHPFDAGNTYIRGGKRICKECGRKRSREWQRARREAACR